MHSQIISMLQRTIFRHFTYICIVFVGLYSLTPLFSVAQAQTLVSGALTTPPPSALFDNQIIVRFKEGYSPTDLSEKIALRQERAQSISGSLQNTQENISLLIAGEDRPEVVKEELDSLISDNQLQVVDTITVANSTVVYEIQSDSTVDEIVEDASSLPVEHIQPNYAYYLLETPNDGYFNRQWGLKAIHADTAWERTKGASSLRVAIIDSGIDKNHPDLIGHVEKSKPIMPGCYNNGDSNGHGTHVAGVIGAMTNNTEGVAGLNWNITLLGYCVVSPSGIGSSLAVAQGIRDATDDGAKIINMSLGGPSFENQDFELTSALEYAASKDVVIVAASGNCGRYAPGEYTDPSMAQCYWGGNADKYLPASSPHAVSVAATGPQGEHPTYSNYGATVDVAAPGGNPSSGSISCTPDGANCILSTWNRSSSCPSSGLPSGYCAIAGTSMAAPHVTGLAALIRAAQPSLNRAQVQALLQNTATDLGQPGKDIQFGYGIIDAQKALESITTLSPTPITLPSTPASPQPTQPSDTCPSKKTAGDYNCDGTIALSDFENWRQDFEKGFSFLTDFEHFRKGFTQN